MIPSVEDIQDALKLGRITQREAEERLFLIRLVERNFRASLSSPAPVATASLTADPDAILASAEDALMA